MFYNHDILTDRKHGVATVWLVATLGSKSTLKKVSRRAILDVNVPKACQTIADPESPMALRLQSSLLYGVSRVFSQQCGYILTDMQSLQDKMRGTLMVMRDLQMDRNVALASEHLNMAVDPGLDFEFDMGLDLSAFDIASQTTGHSSVLSPHSLASTKSSLLPEEELEIRLNLSSEDTPGYDGMNFNNNEEIVTSSVQRPPLYARSDLDEPAIDANPFFDINEDGELIDRTSSQTRSEEAAGLGLIQRPDQISAQSADLHVTLADVQNVPDDNYDDYFMAVDNADDMDVLATEAVSNAEQVEMAAQTSIHADNAPAGLSDHEREETETAVVAPHRPRSARILQIDHTTELTNRQLSEWQNDYTDTMAQKRSERADRQSLAQAKRNAAFWVLEQGIVNGATNFANDREIHPLSAFSGQALLEALTGIQHSVAGRKRSYSSTESQEEDNDAQIRKRRASSEQNNSGSALDQAVFKLDDDDVMLFQGDNGDEEVEMQMGRQPASSLKDRPSPMPWDRMGSSRQGSIRSSVQPGISSSIQGIGGFAAPSFIISGRRSRLTSASPLIGKGRPVPRLASLDPQHASEVYDVDDVDDSNPLNDFTGGLNDDFKLYNPTAIPSGTQRTSQQNEWLAATLEAEALNFLMFVTEATRNQNHNHDADIDVDTSSITFANLLPPENNSYIVAAQGFLHVLTLATKGLIEIEQDDAFGDIEIGVVAAQEDEAEVGVDIENVDVEGGVEAGEDG